MPSTQTKRLSPTAQKKETHRRKKESFLQAVNKAEVRGKECEFCGAERRACLCGFKWQTFDSIDAVKSAIDSYFQGCVESKRAVTLSGLANVLGVSRTQLKNWKYKGGQWAQMFEMARRAIEQFAEEALYEKKHPVAGVIFSLVNSHEWSNNQHFKFDDMQPVFGPMILLPEKKPEGALPSIPQHAESVDTASRTGGGSLAE